MTEPAGTEWVRRRNTASVLRSLRSEGAASRAELAARTGLAKATVGTIVSALAASRAVVEEPSVSTGRGRPGRPVALCGDRFVSVGLEVNVDYVAAVVLDLAGAVVLHETQPVRDGEPLADLTRLAAKVRREVPSRRELVGAVVAVPGLVHSGDRAVAWAPNLDIGGELVPAEVAGALGGDCPVQVSNDADCAAYAESHHGAATDTDSLLYLTGTVGIGAGIVEGGALVRGASGFAGEVGHMPIGDPAIRCGCGRLGCWETSVGLHAMARAVGRRGAGTPVATAQAVLEQSRTDAGVRERLADLGRDLGVGLAVLAAVLDPGVIVLGGYFVPLGDLVLGPAQETLAARLVGPGPGPELRVGALGIEAAALGAAERAFAGVFAGEAELPAR